MVDEARKRLGDAADELQERGKEAMRQHGDLGGTTSSEEMAPETTQDPLKADPEEAEAALDHMRVRAVERAREGNDELDKKREIVGE